MVKKKQDNPLANLTRFDVDPSYVNPVPEINKILGMRHRLSGAEHDKSLVKHGLSGDDGRNSWLKERWDRRADYLEKGMVTPYQWGTLGYAGPGPIDGDGNPIKYNVNEHGHRTTPVDPDQWPDDYYSYGLEGYSAYRAPDYERHGQNNHKGGEIPEWIGNAVHPGNTGFPIPPATTPLYEHKPTKAGAKETQKREENRLKVKETYESSRDSLLNTSNKTGKVEEPALPQASEKPVAKKKKNEPEYIPSKSEKDFAAGRMPGITGTEAEAAASLARERKSRTAKVTGKAKDKLQAEIAAHPDFRGTRQLTDEEVAANEGGAPAPAASKGKGKKKPSAPAAGSREAVEAELATGRSAQREKPRPAEEPKKTAVEQYMSEINDPEHAAKRQADIDAAAAAEKEKPAGRKRNFPNVNNKPAATAAETAAETPAPQPSSSSKVDKLTPEQKAEYDDLVAQGYSEISTKKSEPAADYGDEVGVIHFGSDEEPDTPKAPTGGGAKFILNTDKSGTSEPVYGTASEAKANAERIRQIRTAREGGTMRTSESAPRPADGNFYDWGSETEPTPASPTSPSTPGLGSRLRTFFGGGKGGRAGGAPTPASNAPTTPPSVTSGGTPSGRTSMPAPTGPGSASPTPSAPASRAGSFYNISGAVTFGDQTNLGRQDFGSGSGGNGINVNNSANVNFAPQVIGESTFGNITGGTVNTNPTVASTAGRATSTNRGATVLSTGGPASSGQPTHPRAQNAQRGGRPTTNNAAQTPAAAPAAPAPSNPRRKKP